MMYPMDRSQPGYELNFEKEIQKIIDELLCENDAEYRRRGNKHEKTFKEEA